MESTKSSSGEASTTGILLMVGITIAVAAAIPYFLISGIESYEVVDHRDFMDIDETDESVSVTVHTHDELEYVEVTGGSTEGCNTELSEGCLLFEEESVTLAGPPEDVDITLRTNESRHLVYTDGELRDESAQ